MSQEPEDILSPEDEAEIQRDAIRGKINDDLDVIQQTIDFMTQHPRDVEPEVYSHLLESLAAYRVWAKQHGIGLPQPDIDI